MTRALESLKNFHFNELLLSKVYIVWVKKVQRNNLSWNWRVMQNWRRIDLLFQNWHKEFDKILPEHSKASKIVILMSSFWAKYILFELKKYRRIFFHDTEEWCKIWIITGLLRLENDMRNFAKFPQSTCKCQNWNFDKIFLSKVEIVWASNLQWSCVSWQWRVTQKVKRKWLVVL